MSKTILGIDVGEKTLRIALCNGTAILKSLQVLIPDGLVKGGSIDSYEDVGEFIEEFLEENKISAKECAIILPARHTYLRRITMPKMTVKQLEMSLPFEFRDYLNMDKDMYFYDYAVNAIIDGENDDEEENSEETGQMDLTAAAVSKQIINDYRLMLKDIGLKLVTAVPVEMAYANLIRNSQGNIEGEQCILDLGQSITRFHIFRDGCFEITRELDIGVGDLEKDADVYTTIATDIRKAVNFYSFNNGGREIHDVWCCGSDVHIAELGEVIHGIADVTLHPISEILPDADGHEGLSVAAAAAGAAMQ